MDNGTCNGGGLLMGAIELELELLLIATLVAGVVGVELFSAG